MEIKQLICFKRVAELEHLTQAANELYISQSRLSHVINELEDEIGVKLFDREGRGLKLNPCGKEFYRDVTAFMYQIEDSVKKVRELDKRQSTQLAIATNVSMYMPGLLQAMQTASPELIIRQHSAQRRKIIRMLMDGDIDFALCCPMITEEPELSSTLLHTEAGVIIYPLGHWLKNYPTVSLQKLKNEHFISVGAGYGMRDVQEVYATQYRAFPDIAIETTDTSSVFNYVDGGLGIAYAPKSMTLLHPVFRNRYSEIEEGCVATIGLTWKTNHYNSPSWKLFLDTAIDHFEHLK